MLSLSSIIVVIKRLNQLRPDMLRYDDFLVYFPSFRRSTASSGNEDGIIEVKRLSSEVLG